ncbi:MAG: hypothetical protein ACLVKO_04800 [Dysgonomonas sp.]
MTTTKKVLTASLALIVVGSLGVAFACSRIKKKCKEKDLSIQIV